MPETVADRKYSSARSTHPPQSGAGSKNRVIPGNISRITVEQFLKLIESGLISEEAPIELIDGVMIFKDRSGRGEDPMGIGKKHRNATRLLMELLARVTASGADLLLEAPIRMHSGTRPEPDAAIVKGSLADFHDRDLSASDVLCAIEVSDTSVDNDRDTKLAVYAESGIPQYVLINIPERTIEVYEEPIPSERKYGKSDSYGVGKSVSLFLGTQRLPIAVDDLLRYC